MKLENDVVFCKQQRMPQNNKAQFGSRSKTVFSEEWFFFFFFFINFKKKLFDTRVYLKIA